MITRWDGKPGGTLVLVFNSACQWCDSVAPSWARMAAEVPDRDILGFTTDSPEIGAEYLARHGIHLPIVSITRESDWYLRGIGTRTPAIIAVAPGGEIVFRGHGSQLEEAVAWGPGELPVASRP